MAVKGGRLFLAGVVAFGLALVIAWPDEDEDYCAGRFATPTSPVQQFTNAACTVGRSVIELRDIGARIIVDGQRLYVLDASREVAVTTDYRFDGGALRFASEVTGYSDYRDFVQLAGPIAHVFPTGEPGGLGVSAGDRHFEVVVRRVDDGLTLSEPLAEMPGRQLPPSPTIAPMQCADYDALTVVPALDAVAIFHRGHRFHLADASGPLRIVRTILAADKPPHQGYLVWRIDYVDAALSPEFRQDFGHIERLENAGGAAWDRVVGEYNDYVVRLGRQDGQWTFSQPFGFPLSHGRCLIGNTGIAVRNILRHLAVGHR